jgi:hypothetical protein
MLWFLRQIIRPNDLREFKRMWTVKLYKRKIIVLQIIAD